MPTALPFSRLLATLILFVGLLPLGCSGPKATSSKVEVKVEAEDPLAASRDTLRRDRDIGSCRTIIAQLNEYLARSEVKPPSLDASELEMLTKELGLAEAEINELKQRDFSPLDALDLEERLLFHDAMRSLNLKWGEAPEQQRDRAVVVMAWVMRQVWLAETGGRPIPPVMVLRRGNGNEPERAGVALAALFAAGLDAALVGFQPEHGAVRMWAVAARAGDEVLLFDPRSGRPVGSANSPTTLRQVRAQPALLESLAKAADPPLDPKVIAEKSELYLSPPLSSLGPRMRMLQNLLTLVPPLKVAVEPAALKSRFAKVGVPVQFWNPKTIPGRGPDLNVPMRALAYFYPVSEGGFDRSNPGLRAFDSIRMQLVPWALVPEPTTEQVLPGEPGYRLRDRFGNRFVAFHLEANKPRDQVLRGQFDDATRNLVDLTTNIAKIEDRLSAEQDLDAEALRWVKEMRSAYAQMLRTEKTGETGFVEARSKVDSLNKNSEKIMMLIERAAGPPMEMEATYLLALCKHEQAERQSRRETEPELIREAWQNAAGWWNTFLGKFGTQGWVPKRLVTHARSLQTEAASRLK